MRMAWLYEKMSKCLVDTLSIEVGLKKNVLKNLIKYDETQNGVFLV